LMRPAMFSFDIIDNFLLLNKILVDILLFLIL
jgi:hypothetical protein